MTADGELWAAQAECIGEQPVCAPILASLSIEESRLVLLKDAPTASSKRNERLGQLMGFAIVGIIVALVAAWKWRKNRLVGSTEASDS